MVTEAGTPVAVLLRADEVDLETIGVRNSPVFKKMIERSREQHQAGDSFSDREVRRRLGIE